MFAVGSAPCIRAATQIIAALGAAQLTHIIGHGIMGHDICILENKCGAHRKPAREIRERAGEPAALGPCTGFLRLRICPLWLSAPGNRLNGPAPNAGVNGRPAPPESPPEPEPAEPDEMLPPQGYRGSYRPVTLVLSADQRISCLERQVLELREELADPVAVLPSRH